MAENKLTKDETAAVAAWIAPWGESARKPFDAGDVAQALSALWKELDARGEPWVLVAGSTHSAALLADFVPRLANDGSQPSEVFRKLLDSAEAKRERFANVDKIKPSDWKRYKREISIVSRSVIVPPGSWSRIRESAIQTLVSLESRDLSTLPKKYKTPKDIRKIPGAKLVVETGFQTDKSVREWVPWDLQDAIDIPMMEALARGGYPSWAGYAPGRLIQSTLLAACATETLELGDPPSLLDSILPLARVIGIDGRLLAAGDQVILLVVQRPKDVHYDDGRQLHNANGPAIVSAEGWSGYYVKGKLVSPERVEAAASLTPEALFDEPDPDALAGLIENFGPARLRQACADRILDDNDNGVLYRLDRDGNKPIVVLRRIDSEWDASRLWSRVAPHLTNAAAAIAWLNLRGEAYLPSEDDLDPLPAVKFPLNFEIHGDSVCVGGWKETLFAARHNPVAPAECKTKPLHTRVKPGTWTVRPLERAGRHDGYVLTHRTLAKKWKSVLKHLDKAGCGPMEITDAEDQRFWTLERGVFMGSPTLNGWVEENGPEAPGGDELWEKVPKARWNECFFVEPGPFEASALPLFFETPSFRDVTVLPIDGGVLMFIGEYMNARLIADDDGDLVAFIVIQYEAHDQFAQYT